MYLIYLVKYRLFMTYSFLKLFFFFQKTIEKHLKMKLIYVGEYEPPPKV